MLEPLRIKITHDEPHEIIQDLLIKLGYSWCSEAGGANVQDIGNAWNYLYTRNSGKITKSYDVYYKPLDGTDSSIRFKEVGVDYLQSLLSVKKGVEFVPDSLPYGTLVNLQGTAKRQFDKWMFEYFQEIQSLQTGWGVSFITWLNIVKGWEHQPTKGSRGIYKKVPTIT